MGWINQEMALLSSSAWYIDKLRKRFHGRQDDPVSLATRNIDKQKNVKSLNLVKINLSEFLL